MKISKDAIFAVLTTFCLCALMFSVIPIKSGLPYDPWSDTYDENGKIDMKDIGYMATQFAATGDPTKNVTVMNWPVTNEVLVWHDANTTRTSSIYNASGFGHVHIVWYAQELTGPGKLAINVWAVIFHSGGGYLNIMVSSMDVNLANIAGTLSFPVPSESFYFQLLFLEGTTAKFQFAYYLTYA